MRSALRYFLARQPIAFGIFAASLLVMLFFAVQFLLHLGHVRDDVPENQALEEWMRPRYVAMSYRLPPHVLSDILDIGPPPKEREREPLTMADIAERQGVDLPTLTERVRAGAAAFHEERGK
ncbi:hypothetical protein [Tropicimonas aquimaris]|uniref:Uncharacterized protein n=1 Tax=Tropicimonas aquimaris TaxID=914152 RepID=A0ABW3IVT0_9RHOB